MTFIESLRQAVKEHRVPPIFTSSDLRAAKIEDPNHNLSNYDKKNPGSLNRKVLVSAEIKGETYYTFDEQVFD